jgi:DNA-directed RNA polymerase subunit RPC12/RpoP
MEYNFKCPFCSQELSVDESVAGTETACPTCNQMLIIPTLAQVREAHLTVSATAAATTDASGEPLIKKPNRPLEVTARGDKKLRIRSFRHHEYVKDGRDKFDEAVSEFLHKTGGGNVTSIHSVQYTIDGQTEYGVVIVYTG